MTNNYDPNIPKPKNTIKASQNPFLSNFSQLYNAFSQNHVPLDAVSNAGNHNVAQLVEQSAALTTQVSEIAAYTKDVLNQADQLFYRYQGNGTEIQYSNYQLYPLQNSTLQSQYFTFLPGNIIMYFGTCVPNSTSFQLALNPPICKNIFGISLGVMGTTPNLVSNVGLLGNAQGIFAVVLAASAYSPSGVIPPPQSYIIYGNP